MADKKTVPYTFHKVRAECEQANADAWRAFLNFYGPLCLRLLETYAAGDGTARPGVFEKLLRQLAENDFERLRAMPRQSEREFLNDVRALLLDIAFEGAFQGAAAGAAGSAEGGRTIDRDTLGKLLLELPLMHQEMLFFKLSGYTDATIERMLRVAPHVAAKSMERLAPAHAAAQRLEQDRCPWPAEWLAVLHEARAAKQESCKELHEFMRIQDGQVSWYDKEPTEKHIAGCLYCLERWTGLREVTYWRRLAPALSTVEMERFLRALPVAAAPTKSLLKRVFG